MKRFIYSCFISLILCTNLGAETGGSPVDRYVALAIQGDLQPARAILDGTQAGAVPGTSEAELLTRFRQRFVELSEPSSPGSGSALVDRVVSAYRSYWRQALMKDAGAGSKSNAERQLQIALAAALSQNQYGVTASSSDTVYAALTPALRRQGFHALVSSAPPLQDLFVWRDQETREYEVGLTDQRRTVRVAFLSDFSSLGWKDYAALGLATTTGWVDGDTLYCVAWAYSPGTEQFEVSYLKHETRHLADFERFPGLSSEELEYRAKLTELAFAAQTARRLLEDFSAKGAPNPASPHAAANYRVVRDVYQGLFGTVYPDGDGVWMTVSAAKVNRVARRLLERHTASLISLLP
jgi:hypothetical protein